MSNSEPVESSGRGELRAVDGRIPGRRGLATRQRLLDETAAMLDEVSYRDVAVVDIARRAGTSPATFYQYFADVEAAVLALADDFARAGGEHLRQLLRNADWNDPQASRRIADGFLAFFAEQEALLRLLDLGALEGDERFRNHRTAMLNGFYGALVAAVRDARSTTGLSKLNTPSAVAGVVTSMLVHVAAHQFGFETWGVPQEELSATMASVIDWAVRDSP